MKRRQFMAAMGAGAVAAGLEGCATAGHNDAAAWRPNILFIIADQHRADCLGCYGNKDVRTPHLDALAADGVRYENSFCAFPVCTPSRYSLFSGLYVHEHGGSSNRSTLRPEIATFPRLLRDAGYTTAAVGKMHFTPTYLDVGFQRMFLAEQDGEGRWDDDYHRELMARGLIDINDLEDQRREYRAEARAEYWETFGALPTNLPAEMHSTEWIGRKSLEILDEWGAGGNLLVTSFVKPHHPFDAVLDDANQYDPASLSLLPGWTPECFAHDLALSPGYFPNKDLTEERLRRVIAYYYATIEQIDRQIGAMVARLKQKGLYDNTLIVYVSDHGEYMGHHHMLLKGNYMYDSLARVPLIIRYPRREHGGETITGLVSLIDLAPTVLGQAGVTPADGMHGVDLAAATAGRDVVFAEAGRGAQVMVRTATHKLLVSQKPDRVFLYDLERDPCELNDVSADPAYAGVLAELKQSASDWGGGSLGEPVLDLAAPTITGPNVPAMGDRELAMNYYKKAWDTARATAG